MKFTGPRKLKNLQGLCTPLECMSSKTLLQERRVFLVELSASHGAFASCHFHWGGVFGDVAVKTTAVAWRSDSI